EIGDLKITPSPMQHYVPAWAMTVADRSGARLVYGGDTGPTDRLLAAARRADLLIVEATLRSVTEDEVRRGHCTLDEAIAISSSRIRARNSPARGSSPRRTAAVRQ